MLRPTERVVSDLGVLLSGILTPALAAGHPTAWELDAAARQTNPGAFVAYVNRLWGHLFGVPPHGAQVLPALLNPRFGPLSSGGAMSEELMATREWLDGRWSQALVGFVQTVPVWSETYKDIPAVVGHFLRGTGWSDVAVRFFKLFVTLYVASIMRNGSVRAWPIAKGYRGKELQALIKRLYSVRIPSALESGP